MGVRNWRLMPVYLCFAPSTCYRTPSAIGSAIGRAIAQRLSGVDRVRFADPNGPEFGSGREVCFGPSRPDPGRNAREQDGTRTGRDGPHLGMWMGPKCWKTKHMANLDGTPSHPGGGGIWTGRGPDPREGLDGTPTDSNRLLGISEEWA